MKRLVIFTGLLCCWNGFADFLAQMDSNGPMSWSNTTGNTGMTLNSGTTTVNAVQIGAQKVLHLGNLTYGYTFNSPVKPGTKLDYDASGLVQTTTGDADLKAVVNSTSGSWTGMSCTYTGTYGITGGRYLTGGPSLVTDIHYRQVTGTGSCVATASDTSGTVGGTWSPTAIFPGNTVTYCFEAVIRDIAARQIQTSGQYRCTLTCNFNSPGISCS